MRVHNQGPKLWEEYYDPIELEVYDDYAIKSREVVPAEWRIDFIVQKRLNDTQRDVVNAYLDGLNHTALCITEKKFRYHLKKAIKKMQEIMLDNPYLYRLDYNLLKENMTWKI